MKRPDVYDVKIKMSLQLEDDVHLYSYDYPDWHWQQMAIISSSA